jgi:hypothetical protein
MNNAITGYTFGLLKELQSHGKFLDNQLVFPTSPKLDYKMHGPNNLAAIRYDL